MQAWVAITNGSGETLSSENTSENLLVKRNYIINNAGIDLIIISDKSRFNLKRSRNHVDVTTLVKTCFA